MIKKLAIIIFLALFICTAAMAEEDVPETHRSGDYKYIILDDGTAEIVMKYTGEAKDLIVPSELDGYTVTRIGDYAFFSCTSLTSITMPDSVTSIGDFAFCECISLTDITIPDSVASIGANPFEYCKRLTSINLSPDHPYLETIDGVLFSKPDKRLVCYPLAFTSESYIIPQGIQTIGNEAFRECDSLTGVTIPDGVTSIGTGAFYSCKFLTNTSIPDSVTSIGDAAFYSCKSLMSVTIPDGVTSIGTGAFMK